MTFRQDLRFGMRRLRHTPLFTLTVLATLAMAIAVNVAVFSAVRAMLLRPLPIHRPDRLIVVTERLADRGQDVKEISYRDFVDWRAQSRSCEGLAAIGSTTSASLLERAGHVSRFRTALVSASFFDLVGARARLGRVLTPADDVRGAGRVLVLSDRLWRRLFDADPSIVGRSIPIGGAAFSVVGVMAPEFAFPADAEAWTPVVPALESTNARWKVDTLEARYFGLLTVVGRLRDGVAAEDARAELDVIARRLPESPHATASGPAVAVTPLLDHLFGPTRRGLVLLFAMVCFVLLIACANVAGLVLARAARTSGEFAVRSALGASRWQILREWVVEIAIVIAAAGALGVGAAWAGLGPLLSLAPASVPRLHDARIDLPVLAFAVGVCVLATLLCAMAPAMRASARAARNSVSRARSAGGPGPLVARGLLTAGQVAMATVLLTAAVLLVRSFDALRQLDLGFGAGQVVTLDVEPQVAGAEGYRQAYDAILERVAALPGVQAAGAVYLRPLHGSAGLDSGYLLDGQRLDSPDVTGNVMLNYQAVTPGYFETMRIPLRRGRAFSPRDSADAPGVAIVSERTARRLWPGREAVGQRLAIASGVTAAGTYPTQTVVGVVPDVRYRGIDDPRFDVYMPASQTLHRVRHLMVRTSGDPATVVKAVRAAIAGLPGRTLVEYVDTMDGVVAEAVAPWRFSMSLLAGLAAVGGVLAITGLFALVAYTVDLRARELAVRMALGASQRGILGMVLWQGARVAAIGLAIGLVVSAALVSRLSPLLFEVPPHDAFSFGTTAGVLGGSALLASYLAALRGTAIDPARLIREP
jgi:predicted permease